MNTIRLVRPSIAFREQYLEFYKDWVDSGEDIIPWTVEKDPEDFEAFLEFLYAEDSEEKLTTPGWVPHSTYWLVIENDILIGAVNFRHRLNEHLLNCGGHIGFGIRPSYRRQGYGDSLLSGTLQIAKAAGLESVLMVCDADNIGSEKTIIKHGGKFESLFTEPNGNVIKRFWISLIE